MGLKGTSIRLRDKGSSGLWSTLKKWGSPHYLAGGLQAPPASQRAQGEFFPHLGAGKRSGLEERNQGPGPHIWMSELEH